eukprot:TRINITY_DN17726_c0_g1_i1.p1 TRINITY_DN17726_c0_g1~~TRINITY_DN17726_c0_g1_i1.p1  ORF type:complete len:495 (+),score=81.77 TRINITY_DN17726_c0_g1_i1:163-1647(+)
MFHNTSASTPLEERTVGVLVRDDKRTHPGVNLLCLAKETFLLDNDGRVVHTWRSSRRVFSAYLLPSGNLIRDGSENIVADGFRAGGAAGWIEEVTWDNKVVWAYSTQPYRDSLSHHDLEALPNGNVLAMVWERKTKEEALIAGRRPELVPHGEVWDNVVIELKPDREHGTAEVVWRWSVWDHLYSAKEHGDDAHNHPGLFDINYCPPGGKAGQRNMDLLKAGAKMPPPTGGHSREPCTGEKDWIHANSVSYDPVKDQVLISFNVPSEIIIVDHSTTMEEAKGRTGGTWGRGGDILFRWGNPQTYGCGSRMDQQLFCQHGVQFIKGGNGTILLFNNGRIPDRHWSTVEEITPPTNGDGSFTEPWTESTSGAVVDNPHKLSYGPSGPTWTFGPRKGRLGSFYCTHISWAQRLDNGNTLITHGPDGLVVEVTREGQEVWRYLSPALLVADGDAIGFVRQGDHRPMAERYSLFNVQRYAMDFCPQLKSADAPTFYLEA